MRENGNNDNEEESRMEQEQLIPTTSRATKGISDNTVLRRRRQVLTGEGRSFGFKASLLMNVLLSILYTSRNFYSAVGPKTMAQINSASRRPKFNRTEDDVVYAHVHMAKATGSELNGAMTLQFDHVCGHKGYSYDAIAHNDRAAEWVKEHPKAALTSSTNVGDIYSQVQPTYNRGRVPLSYIKEIGFEDCDWISLEAPARIWLDVADKIGPMEFHVPCRDPVDHLLSMCNYHSKHFNCDVHSDQEIADQVQNCLLFLNRFDTHFFRSQQTAQSLHCFNSSFVEPYLAFMKGKLQARRVVRPYVHRDTNKPRDKKNECLLQNKDVALQVEEWMISNLPYFQFCKKCIGSKNDLLLTAKDPQKGP